MYIHYRSICIMYINYISICKSSFLQVYIVSFYFSSEQEKIRKMEITLQLHGGNQVGLIQAKLVIVFFYILVLRSLWMRIVRWIECTDELQTHCVSKKRQKVQDTIFVRYLTMINLFLVEIYWQQTAIFTSAATNLHILCIQTAVKFNVMSPLSLNIKLI